LGKDKLLSFTKFLYGVFTISTVLAIIIVYLKVKSSFAIYFVVAYAILALFVLIYVPAITLLNSRKLKWINIRKRLVRFIVLFALFGLLNCSLDYFFRHVHINLLKDFSIALGLAFGISFFDITFLKRNK
jgi:hypothetical protein